jgi:hypothetical protein
MSQPAKVYFLESTTNAEGKLIESNAGNPVSVTVPVRIGIGVKTKVGNSRPGV